MTVGTQPRRNRWQRAFSSHNRGRSLFVAGDVDAADAVHVVLDLIPRPVGRLAGLLRLQLGAVSVGRCLASAPITRSWDSPIFSNMLGDSLEAQLFRTELEEYA